VIESPVDAIVFGRGTVDAPAGTRFAAAARPAIKHPSAHFLSIEVRGDHDNPSPLSAPALDCIAAHNVAVRISARSDYAVRAAVVLAVDEAADGTVTAEAIARAQEIPLKFLLNILNDLKRGRIVASQRGPHGGYRLARPAESISVADVIRAMEGPLASVHEIPPERVHYPPPAESLQQVWVAVRSSLRSVLEVVTIADLAAGTLPDVVVRLSSAPEAWSARA
jgi:Rrf2 family protein